MLTVEQISQVKGLLNYGHKQQDIAAYYGVNSGRIAEINLGKIGSEVIAAKLESLPNIALHRARYLAPGQSIKEQIAIFEELLVSSRGFARPLWISPDLAAHILSTRNGSNRKINTTKVAELVDQIEQNNYQVTGATIIFGVSGRVLDGQHRLLACVQSKKPIKSYVVFGIEDGAFALIDTGRKRTNMDAFHIAGVQKPEVTAKAVRWLMLLADDPLSRVTFQNQEVLDYYTSNVDKNLLAKTIAYAEEIERAAKSIGSKMPTAPIAALLYRFCKVNQKDANSFISSLIENRGAGRTVHRFIKNTLERNNGRIHEAARNAAITKAWNAHRAGEAISVTSIRWNEASGEEYPEIL